MAAHDTGKRHTTRTHPRDQLADEVSRRTLRSGRTPSPRRERLGQIGHWFFLVAGPLILLPAIAAIILYVRLLHGPVSLKYFSSTIENSVNAELDDVTAKIDDAVLTLLDGPRLELRLVNLRFIEADGDLVASAPLASVDLSMKALSRFRIAPERVFLIEPKVSLYYTEAAGLVMTFDQPAIQPSGSAGPGTKAVSPSNTTAVQKDTPVATGDPLPQTFHRVDLARTLAESARRARQRQDASSEIKEIGLRNAAIVMHYGGEISELSVEEATFSLDHHKKGSVISGAATFRSGAGPWHMTFRTEESEKGNQLKVSATVQDLIPSSLAKTSPQLSLLEPLDTRVSAELAVELSTQGHLKGAGLIVDIAPGRVNLPSLSRTPLLVDGGQFKLDYDAQAGRLRVAPSTLKWGDSSISVEGDVTRDARADGHVQWTYNLRGLSGALAAEEFGISPITLDALTASGRIIPQEGLVQLADFTLRAGGAEIRANGDMITAGQEPSTRLEAKMTPMTLETLKALWPRAATPDARTWVGHHVTHGTLKSGSLKLLSGNFLDQTNEGSALVRERISMTIEAANLKMTPFLETLPIEAPRALIRVENDALEITIPEASVVGGAKPIPLKGGRFTIVNVKDAVSTGELVFRAESTLSASLDALARSGLETAGRSLPLNGVDGKVEGNFKLTLPLSDASDTKAKIEGKARISEIRGKHKPSKLDVQGGSIDIDLGESGVLAMGELILNGVVAKLNMQRIFDAPPEAQPPLRVSANLDNSDRTQLGLDVNHLVQGNIAIEVAIGKGEGDVPTIKARADLTNAELLFEDLAWRKVPGRTAGVEFDIAPTGGETIELKNFRLVGDNVAIEGSMSIDADREVREFAFPNFSLNVVTRLEVEGKVGSDKIWKIKAKGSTFDGKDLFRSLLALGRPADTDLKPLRPAAGVDLTAEVDTVLGHSDLSLRSVKIKLSERADQLVALDVQGALEGGKPLAVLMKPAGGRKIFAESLDAGQAFKLVGFYPNLQGGRMRLEVDLAGRGAAEKTGVLWVEDFRVLGDPVLQDIYTSGETGGPAIDGTPQGQRRVTREVFEFSRMKVPFSVGHGQFVLDESYLRGPLVGASIRGKVDYAAARLALGGTYVPLQGINSAFCEIPLVGPIVSGLDCQGVFGITYAIQGPMAGPQVIVNPLSMFTPGILRGIMELTNPNPVVQPRSETSRAPAEQRVRASSSAASSGEEATDTSIDGWSSETKPVEAQNKPGPKAKK